MSGRVLCISGGSVAHFYHAKEGRAWFCSQQLQLHEFTRMVHAGAHFVERERAERDPGWVQLIPVCVIASGARILCLERSSKSDRPELKAKWTALFGGHVDEADNPKLPTHKDVRNDGDKWQTVLNAVKREIHEELGIRVNGDPIQFAGLAIDPTNTVGRHHLGVVFYCQVSKERLRLTSDLDLAEFNVSGKRKVVRFLSPAELYRLQSNFDPWRTLFLGSDFAHTQSWDDGAAPESAPPLLRAMRA